jgi:predicted dinucleotide-binding enzyme
MKIAILGAGNVGATLGAGWAKCGHTVVFATRDPLSQKTLAAVHLAGPNASSADVASAARASEVIVLATPWANSTEALVACGDLTGKIVVDTTNAVLPGWKLPTPSGTQQLSERFPGARLVKALNSVGWDVMQHPVFVDRAAAMLFCGDQPEAKATVVVLISDLGFDPVDAGALDTSGLLDAAALLWIRISIQQKDRQFAFAKLSRETGLIPS